MQFVLQQTLYFVDRASRHKFMLITNLMHFFMYLPIHFIFLHVSSIKCSSSGDRIISSVTISLCKWMLDTKQSLTQTNHTRWCINTIRSPDDEHFMLETYREMKWINKYMKKCIRLVINMNLYCNRLRQIIYGLVGSAVKVKVMFALE